MMEIILNNRKMPLIIEMHRAIKPRIPKKDSLPDAYLEQAKYYSQEVGTENWEVVFRFSVLLSSGASGIYMEGYTADENLVGLNIVIKLKFYELFQESKNIPEVRFLLKFNDEGWLTDEFGNTSKEVVKIYHFEKEQTSIMHDTIFKGQPIVENLTAIAI